MKNLETVMQAIDSIYCTKKLKKLIELNPDLTARFDNTSSDEVWWYDFVNSDGELLCILPFNKSIAISSQVQFWFSIIVMVDDSKLH